MPLPRLWGFLIKIRKTKLVDNVSRLRGKISTRAMAQWHWLERRPCSLHITLEIGWVSFFALWLDFGLSSDIFFFIFHQIFLKNLLQAMQVLEKIAFGWVGFWPHPTLYNLFLAVIDLKPWRHKYFLLFEIWRSFFLKYSAN